MKSKHLILSAVVALAGFLPQSKAALFSGDLGSADSFAILAGTTVTSTGSTVIYGNVGVFPGSAVTGLLPANVHSGAIYGPDDAIVSDAKTAASHAYDSLALETSTGLNQSISSATLLPGVWTYDSDVTLTGKLILDGNYDPNARFDFLLVSALTTASGSSIDLINGAQWANVFWQVGSSATLGTGTEFKGSILAHTSISLDTGANMFGRALALTGAVDLHGDNINITAVPEPNAYLAGFCTIAVFLFGWRNRK